MLGAARADYTSWSRAVVRLMTLVSVGPTLGEENKDTLVLRGQSRALPLQNRRGRNVLTAGAEVQSLGSEQHAAAKGLNERPHMWL